MTNDLPSEIRVSIPEGATPEEDARLVTEATDRVISRKVDDDLDDLLGGFGK